MNSLQLFSLIFHLENIYYFPSCSGEVEFHSITRSFHHSITPSLHHSITPSLHHSITPSLHHSITPSLHHSITPSLHHSITPSLHHSITPSLHHSITPSLHHSITPSLHHSITPSLHHSITPSLHHSITPSLHHSITPSLHHTFTSRQTFENPGEALIWKGKECSSKFENLTPKGDFICRRCLSFIIPLKDTTYNEIGSITSYCLREDPVGTCKPDSHNREISKIKSENRN